MKKIIVAASVVCALMAAGTSFAQQKDTKATKPAQTQNNNGTKRNTAQSGATKEEPKSNAMPTHKNTKVSETDKKVKGGDEKGKGK